MSETASHHCLCSKNISEWTTRNDFCIQHGSTGRPNSGYRYLLDWRSWPSRSGTDRIWRRRLNPNAFDRSWGTIVYARGLGFRNTQTISLYVVGFVGRTRGDRIRRKTWACTAFRTRTATPGSSFPNHPMYTGNVRLYSSRNGYRPQCRKNPKRGPQCGNTLFSNIRICRRSSTEKRSMACGLHRADPRSTTR